VCALRDIVEGAFALLQGWEDSTQLGKDSAAIIGTSSATTSTATTSVTTAASLRGSLEDRLEREYLLSSQAASSSTSTPVPPLSSFTQAPISTYSPLTSLSLTEPLSNKYATTTASTTTTTTSTYSITSTTVPTAVPVYKPTLWKASVSPPPTPPSPTKTPKYTFSSSHVSTNKTSSIFQNDDDLSKFEDPIKYNSWRASKLIEETQSLLKSQQEERASLAAKVVVSSSPVTITTSTYTTVSSATKDSTLSGFSVTSVKTNDSSSTVVKVEEDPSTVQSPPNSTLPTTLPILDHSPGEVYTIPEEEEETSSPLASDGVTSLRRRGGQFQSSQDQLNLTPPDTPPYQSSSCLTPTD
jgi:hypothetical protein